MSRHAAITIISRNYFAFARTLAESYRRHHPTHDFIIVLVDRADGLVPAELPCGAQVVEVAAFDVPDLARMIYRYSIMELNTAVKPFVLDHLFRRHDYQTIVYLDPDIWVLGPLEEVRRALDRGSIVLTPHMRRPYFDGAMPSDRSILQSGTYNLGFIALKRSDSALRLLEWWKQKLHVDCVVDIPNGLFVDQKWIDLVPGFFPDHALIHHPGYNAAYWNIHERPITGGAFGWLADGQPLVFFHFSGYAPDTPSRLSKHQDRHTLDDLPDLRRLTDRYGQALRSNGHDESRRWPYAFETLANGVTIPLDLVARVMQWAARHAVPTPCPVMEADAFCRFLMSRDVIPDRPDAILLLHFLLEARSDVAAAFPSAVGNHDDPGFRAWIQSSGIREHKLAELLPFEQTTVPVNRIDELFQRLQAHAGPAVPSAADVLGHGSRGVRAFVDWASIDGARAASLDEAHVDALIAAIPGLNRILHLYFLRADLQTEFPDLAREACAAAFVRWLQRQRHALGLSVDQVSLFREFASVNAEMLARAAFLYLHQGHEDRATPSLYRVDERCREIGTVDDGGVARWLGDERSISPWQHYVAAFGADRRLLHDTERITPPGLAPEATRDFVARLRAQAAASVGSDSPRVNLAGFMAAASGMGESGRSMLSTLRAAAIDTTIVTLPNPAARLTELPDGPVLFGWPAARADLSIVVANADSMPDVRRCLPDSFAGRVRVGYWVWETEDLPPRWRAAQAAYDEIWTPSGYSAAAIQRSVDRPVRVLPHVLDFGTLDAAEADRARFGLPDSGTVLGFAFDPLSVLERKNVRGLVRAFLAAFRGDDDAYLILKVNSDRPYGYDFASILAEVDTDRVLVLDGVMERTESLAFLKSLDAYVSLHRSEGFGLTCAEAMACGVPVIASRYSGNLEFMDDSNSLLVTTDPIQTDRPFGAYPAGTRWGDPRTDEAVAAMRRMLDPEERRRIGEAGHRSVRERLSPQRIARQLRERLADSLAAIADRGGEPLRAARR